MNRDELLRRANRFTQARYGLEITERQLRDWVDEGLVPGPYAKGRKRRQNPDWQWSGLSYRHVLVIARLKQQGLIRNDQLRIELWLRGAGIDFQRLQASLIKESARMRKQLSKPMSTINWSLSQFRRQPERSQRGLIKALAGNQDAVVIHYPLECLPSMMAKLINQDAGHFDWQGALTVMGEQLGVPDLAHCFDWARRSFGNTFSAIANGLDATLSNPEENTGTNLEMTISQADENLFNNARLQCLGIVWGTKLIMRVMPSSDPEITKTRNELLLMTKLPIFRASFFVILLRFLVLRQATSQEDSLDMLEESQSLWNFVRQHSQTVIATMVAALQSPTDPNQPLFPNQELNA